MASSVEFLDRIDECAKRLAESGVAALSGLYDLTSQRLVRYAITLTRNQHDAEDAVQAALVRVARRPSRLQEIERPWPYLLKMVRNEALAAMRRKRRWSLVPNLSDLLTRCLVDEAEQEEKFRAVWSALRKLPAAQAEVVVLKIWEQMTFAEIADFLEISSDTAASRYRYAIDKLSRGLTSLGVEVEHG